MSTAEIKNVELKNVASESLYMTLAQAARRMPGGRVSTATAWRWTTRGFLVNGVRIRLKSYRFGRALRIRREDVIVFAEALAKANAEAIAA